MIGEVKRKDLLDGYEELASANFLDHTRHCVISA